MCLCVSGGLCGGVSGLKGERPRPVLCTRPPPFLCPAPGALLYEPTADAPHSFAFHDWHQDNAYFEFRDEGPVGTLSYTVPTSEARRNGPLYVVPGTHKRGGFGSERKGAYNGLHEHNAYITHVDTRSHLGLDPAEWTFDDAIEIPGCGCASRV